MVKIKKNLNVIYIITTIKKAKEIKIQAVWYKN